MSGKPQSGDSKVRQSATEKKLTKAIQRMPVNSNRKLPKNLNRFLKIINGYSGILLVNQTAGGDISKLSISAPMRLKR
jgi:hypothetical protein